MAGPPPGCPAHGGRTPLYGPEFAADPESIYSRLRQDGPVAHVDLAPQVPATLILGYAESLDVLRRPDTFSKDPRNWPRAGVPDDSPVLPMMMYRPNAVFCDNEQHARYRGAITDSLAKVDPAVVREHVTRNAEHLISAFAGHGRADLVLQYAGPLPIFVINALLGCPVLLSERLAAGIAGIFDGVDAEQANADLSASVMELINLKRRHPGADLTSWLMAHHSGLDDEELAHQLLLLFGTGVAPTTNLIANTVRLMLTDERFAGGIAGGSVPVDDAIDEILWTNPPIVNYSITYPVEDTTVAGTHLPKHEPVVVSYAAANTELTVNGGQRAGNRAHLSWGAGAHLCPAQSIARIMATVAIETLLDHVTDLELAVPAHHLTWRPGPFHRALTALPVQFPPTTPVQSTTEMPGESPCENSPAPSPSIPQAATSTPRPTSSGPAEHQPWWNFLAKWWRGQ